MNLVASLIVRNEMSRYLEPCVNHLLTYCNEVRVVDDNSDDGTFEWLDEQDRVNVIRNTGPAFYEHEAQARQLLYEHVFAASPDYVLAIDADEVVGDPLLIRQACQQGQPVYTLSLIEIWSATEDSLQVRIDGLWKARTVPILYKPQAGWKIRNKQLACGREPLEVVKMYGRARPTGSSLLHLGWACSSERVARAARYDVHDGGRFHQDRHLQSILWQEQKDRRLRLASERWPNGLSEIAPEIVARANR